MQKGKAEWLLIDLCFYNYGKNKKGKQLRLEIKHINLNESKVWRHEFSSEFYPNNLAHKCQVYR